MLSCSRLATKCPYYSERVVARLSASVAGHVPRKSGIVQGGRSTASTHRSKSNKAASVATRYSSDGPEGLAERAFGGPKAKLKPWPHDSNDSSSALSRDAARRRSDDLIARALRKVGKDCLVPRGIPGRAPRLSQGVLRLVPTETGLEESPSLMDIVARRIAYQATQVETNSHASPIKFAITPAEQAFLATSGEHVDHIRTYAEILAAEESQLAVTLAKRHTDEHGPGSLPIAVLSYILRRANITASALQTLLQLIQNINRAQNCGEIHYWSPDTFYVVSVSLYRHARAVLPDAIPGITTLALESFRQHTQTNSKISGKTVARLTGQLNQLMRHIATQTRVEPFKNLTLQHTAIVEVLSFMNAHEPPLLISRVGYRAVTQVQLAQKKSLKDQHWAELKALSWPPWKTARTAMDAYITAEDHGTSHAARTIQSAQSAGFSSRRWEEAAQIYSGWDVDQTPTIQTRHVLPEDRGQFHGFAQLWKARIATCRTTQEAWACFIEYERTETSELPDQAVCLAMFTKLHQEELRARGLNRPAEGRDLPPIYPGDMPAVQSLPPSTHLYTYTAYPIPTIDEFAEQLGYRGVQFRGNCLAFLITTASSREASLRWVSECQWTYSGVKTADLPSSLFTAMIHFLTCFPWSHIEFDTPSHLPLSITLSDNTERSIKSDHSIGYAMQLLRLRQDSSPHPWHLFLRMFCGRTGRHGHSALAHRHYGDREPLPPNLERARGTMIAYDITREVIGMMHAKDIGLDNESLFSLSVCVGRATAGAWRVLRLEQAEANGFTSEQVSVPYFLLQDALIFLKASRHTRELRQEFWRVIGGQATPLEPTKPETSDGADIQVIPRVLSLPTPALLHSYIRAMGWNAEYEALQELVRWMASNSEALATQRSRHRNSKAVMRRAVIALRAFLQRDLWFTTQHVTRTRNSNSDETAMQLQRLEQPAPSKLVAEIRELVDSQPDWGGWPSDDEVREYTHTAAFRHFLDGT